MLLVLKKTSQYNGSFEHQNHNMLKLMGKKILTIVRPNNVYLRGDGNPDYNYVLYERF